MMTAKAKERGLRELTIESRILAGNPLGDPSRREIFVWAPTDDDRAPLPTLYLLSGFASTGRSLLNYSFGSEELPQRLQRLTAQGMPPVRVVLVDAMTRYGGSQYLNSPATGRYQDYVVEEVVPFVDRAFAGNGRRGVAGKSSGGFGALRLVMAHPSVFHAAACHSGDMHFGLCYASDFPLACRVLQKHAGSTATFFRSWEAAVPKPKEAFAVLDLMAMSAAYSPKPGGDVGDNFDLPIEIESCSRIDEVWARWQANDPLELIEHYENQEALRSLRALYFDCGTRDEFFLDFGARKFARRLRELGIAHEHEEFDDGHRDTSYRYDVSLPRLAKALT